MKSSRRFFVLATPWVMACTAVALWFLALGPVGVVRAADIIVNPGDSIQAAINSAFPGDTILLSAGVYTDNSFTLNKPVNIVGAGADQTIIYASSGQRVVNVSVGMNQNTVISGVQLINGRLLSTTTSCPAYCGAGIYLSANARPLISHVIISDSIASGNGGGMYVEGTNLVVVDNLHLVNNHSQQGRGGGIYSTGRLYIQEGTFTGNTALVHGGAIYALEELTTDRTTLSYNRATEQRGGAIYANEGWTDEQSLLHDNEAFTGGGAVYANVQILLTGTELRSNHVISGNGGALYGAGVLATTDALLVDNSAVLNGGAIYADRNVALTNTTLEGNHAERHGGALYANGTGPIFTAVISASQFLSNTADMRGGAMYLRGNTTLSGGSIHANHALNHGGGIFGETDSELILQEGTSLTNNHATQNGGALYSSGTAELHEAHLRGNESGNHGGGVYASGVFTMHRSTVANNIAMVSGGGLYLTDGAALHNNLLLANQSSGSGAGIYYGGNTESLHVVHNTVASANSIGGTAVYVNSGTALITNTILSNYSAGIAQVGSSVVEEDYNLFHALGLTSTGTINSGGNSLTGNPLFVNLANGNAGLQPTSPAIDAGVDLGVTEDLLGNPRPAGPAMLPDIGAVEWQGFEADLQIGLTADPEPVVYGHILTYTLTITNAGPDEATGITVTHMLPAEMGGVGVVDGDWACDDTGLPTLTCVYTGTMASNATSHIVVTGTAPLVAGVYTSTATVETTGTADPVAANNTATITTTVIRYDIYLPLITR